jgi:hypothetical protein
MYESMSNGHQVLSDGHRVWVNAPNGASVARVSTFGSIVMIDIHSPVDGAECWDCRKDLTGAAAWTHFLVSLALHFGVKINVKHMPSWAQQNEKSPPGHG